MATADVVHWPLAIGVQLLSRGINKQLKWLKSISRTLWPRGPPLAVNCSLIAVFNQKGIVPLCIKRLLVWHDNSAKAVYFNVLLRSECMLLCNCRWPCPEGIVQLQMHLCASIHMAISTMIILHFRLAVLLIHTYGSCLLLDCIKLMNTCYSRQQQSLCTLANLTFSDADEMYLTRLLSHSTTSSEDHYCQ